MFLFASDEKKRLQFSLLLTPNYSAAVKKHAKIDSIVWRGQTTATRTSIAPSISQFEIRDRRCDRLLFIPLKWAIFVHSIAD